MRFGVNYTPPDGWFYSWLDFSETAVGRDLEQIAALGVDHVRIFPIWPIVQPNRTLIRRSALADVARVVDIAGSLGLDVNVDALQGHLSSFDFLPSWLESWHRRNLFTDSDVVASTAEYVRALSETVAGHDHLLGVTVGNEVNQFAHAPHPAPHPVTAGDGDRWLDTMVAAARAGLGATSGGGPLVTVGQYDAAWYADDQPFGPEHAARHGDATVVHSWVFNGASRVHGPMGTAAVRHAEFLLQLAAAWNRDPERPNWLQEVGAPTNVVPVGDAPEFLAQTVGHALDVQRLFGITWWCSHDVSRGLADFPDLEYDLGLFTNDGRRKPTGERFAEVIADHRRAAGRVLAPVEHAAVLDDTRPGARASCAPGGAFSVGWAALATEFGRGPQVVLQSELDDASALVARGIMTLHRLPDDIDACPVAVAHPATMR